MKALLSIVVIGLASVAAKAADGADYDVVIVGGRVMDPASGRDEVLNVGITGDKIAALSKAPLSGKRVIDARAKIVAPGFIDLHSHVGDDVATTSYLVRDGITTHLELEMGAYPVAPWYAKRAGRHQLNYGASVSHLEARRAAQVEDPEFRRAAASSADSNQYSATHAIPDAVYPQFLAKVKAGLEAGGIGVGSGTQYGPGITRREMLDVTRLVAESKSCLFTHIRYGSLVEPGSTRRCRRRSRTPRSPAPASTPCTSTAWRCHRRCRCSWSFTERGLGGSTSRRRFIPGTPQSTRFEA